MDFFFYLDKGLDIRDYSNHLLKISAGRISAIEILIKYFQHV